MKNALLLWICLCLTAPAAVFSQISTQLNSSNTDLKITFTGGKQYVAPGEKMNLEVGVFQVNGSAPQQDVRIDLAIVSRRSYRIPVPLAVYSAEFSEGALLAGGRTYWSIPATGIATKTFSGTLPANLPPGKYYLATVVDAGNSVAEWDEYNNVDYFAIEVKKAPTPPAEVVFKDFQEVLRWFEVYMAGEKEHKGQIFVAKERDNLIYGSTSSIYQPKAIESSAIAFSPKEEAYFVDANKFDIYRTNGETEEKVYTHHTYVRDIVFDKQGNLFFSEATGAGANGSIYKFNFVTKRATKYMSVPLGQLGGFWAGDFAFSPSNQLYVSNGNEIPASLFKYENGRFEKVYTNGNGSIRGFFFLTANEILFADQGKALFFLRNFSEKVRAMETQSIERIEDVWLLAIPSVAKESIHVRFKDGDDMWPLTYVHLRGPNLYWRTGEQGYSKPVSDIGTAQFANLPRGKYWLHADIRADLGWGFRPYQHVVNCAGNPVTVAFHKPVKGVDF